MAETILNTMAALIKSRLEAISTGSGYEVTIARVDQTSQWERVEPEDLSIIMRVGQPTLDPDGPQGHEQFEVDIELMMVRRISEDDASATETSVHEMWSAVHKRLMEDVQHTWLGDHLVMADIVVGPDEAPWEGVTVAPMTFRIVYRHERGDPYVSLGGG